LKKRNSTSTERQDKELMRAGTWLKWLSTCLASIRPWVQIPRWPKNSWALKTKLHALIPSVMRLLWKDSSSFICRSNWG
jgi:hypothetical protein